jgi:hypothetical protein
MTRPSRTPTTLAVGFLLLDAILLLYGGVAWRRPVLVGAGIVCIGVGVLVVVAWRRYRRTVRDLDAAQRELQQEIESIRELLQRQHLHN